VFLEFNGFLHFSFIATLAANTPCSFCLVDGMAQTVARVLFAQLLGFFGGSRRGQAAREMFIWGLV